MTGERVAVEEKPHEHLPPCPDPKVGHERQVLQRAAAEALRAVEAAHDQFATANWYLEQAQKKAQVARQELADKLLLFEQFRLSFDEVFALLPCCKPPQDRVKVWERIAKDLTY